MAALAAVTVQLGRVHLRRTRERNSAVYLSELEEHAVAGALLGDEELTAVAPGVAVRSFRTTNLDVTLVRLDPGAEYVAPVPTRTGTLLNLGAHDVELELNGERQLCAGGMYRTVPGFRRWRVANPGDDVVHVARVEHLTSGTAGRPSQPGPAGS
jgi:hypothetical protein